MEATRIDEANPRNQNCETENPNIESETRPLSKNAQKKLLKQQRYEAKKAEKKAAIKEQKKQEAERKRREWEETLSKSTEEERLKLIESRRGLRKERMGKRSEEREKKIERLTRAREEGGQKIVVDLEFSHLMAPNEIHSLVQQIMYCYSVNGRCAIPCHLWLTGCTGEISQQLHKLPGFDKWLIEKESKSYIEVLQDRKEKLVYLTPDSETILDDLDPKKIYIVGGLVDRNRWKGITMKKATDQGIQTAKLPIGNYLKLSSSQVLTVNQVVEILLKFLETRDWKTSFFQVIPQRKRSEADVEGSPVEEIEGEEVNNGNLLDRKRVCTEIPSEDKFSVLPVSED